jgi:tRNA A-37 threonylcarbamoyl transferase component Bud32
MMAQGRTPVPLSPHDSTLDAGALSLSGAAVRCPKVHVCEGSDPGLTRQTQWLLRLRLRASALVLFLASGVFFVWSHVGMPPDLSGLPDLDAERNILSWCHLSHVLTMAVLAAVLWRSPSLALRTLRGIELGIFGITTIFFVNVQHFDVRYCSEMLGFVPMTTGLWFLLLFTYAIFIPNDWRRAAVVMAVMVVAGFGGYLVDAWRHPVVAILVAKDDPWSAMVLKLIIGYGASVYGTYLINTLRTEAYEAREFGQYKLKRLLGAGGMGEVYLAEHQLLKRPCAIKLIRAGKTDDPRSLARFEREVQSIAALSHWNTIEIFDYGRTDAGTFYYVMEYLPGMSVGELIDRHGPQPPERVVYLLEQICDALREAHAAGLVHRDVKPGNIFSAQRGGVYDVAKLLDFGLVKTDASSDSLHLTQDGTITGSPLYMSPEQATGDAEPDARSDLYSVGCVAYYMLTGHAPFEADKPLKVLMAHANQTVTPPSQLRPEVPADVEEVVLRCLAKLPAQRYPSAVALAEAFRQCECYGKWTRDDAAKWWSEAGRNLPEPAAT